MCKSTASTQNIIKQHSVINASSHLVIRHSIKTIVRTTVEQQKRCSLETTSICSNIWHPDKHKMGDLNGWCFNSQVHAWCLYLVSDATRRLPEPLFTLPYITSCLSIMRQHVCFESFLMGCDLQALGLGRGAASEGEYPVFWMDDVMDVPMTSFHFVIRYQTIYNEPINLVEPHAQSLTSENQFF